MKTETATKSLQLGESLEAQSGQGLEGIKLNNFTDDRGSSEQSTDMNSLFGGVKQDAQVDQSTSSTFVEAMNEVDAQGQKTDKIENMQSIIKQARAFVNDGGGAMHIELSPEGMGNVQLKVAVQDGQVNVEMLADNQKARKALEEGLTEIKGALEGHKLQVETLKVSMAQDVQSDFSDMRDHAQDQANRDFAEQFLGQLKDSVNSGIKFSDNDRMKRLRIINCYKSILADPTLDKSTRVKIQKYTNLFKGFQELDDKILKIAKQFNMTKESDIKNLYELAVKNPDAIDRQFNLIS